MVLPTEFVTAAGAPPFVFETLLEYPEAYEIERVVDHPTISYRIRPQTRKSVSYKLRPLLCWPVKEFYGRGPGSLTEQEAHGTFMYFTQFKMLDGTTLSRLEFCKAFACGVNAQIFTCAIVDSLSVSHPAFFNQPLGKAVMAMKEETSDKCDLFFYIVIHRKGAACLNELMLAERHIYRWQETSHVPASWEPLVPLTSFTELNDIPASASGDPISTRSTLPPYFVLAAKRLLDIHQNWYSEELWEVWRYAVPDQRAVPWFAWSTEFFPISTDEIVPFDESITDNEETDGGDPWSTMSEGLGRLWDWVPSALGGNWGQSRSQGYIALPPDSPTIADEKLAEEVDDEKVLEEDRD